MEFVDSVEDGSTFDFEPWRYETGPTLDLDFTIGRLREDRLLDWRFVCLSHNTIRGAAGNLVLAAELALKDGLIGTRFLPPGKCHIFFAQSRKSWADLGRISLGFWRDSHTVQGVRISGHGEGQRMTFVAQGIARGGSAQLRHGDKVVDERVERIGIRTIEVDRTDVAGGAPPAPAGRHRRQLDVPPLSHRHRLTRPLRAVEHPDANRGPTRRPTPDTLAL